MHTAQFPDLSKTSGGGHRRGGRIMRAKAAARLEKIMVGRTKIQSLFRRAGIYLHI